MPFESLEGLGLNGLMLDSCVLGTAAALPLPSLLLLCSATLPASCWAVLTLSDAIECLVLCFADMLRMQHTVMCGCGVVLQHQ